MPESGAGMRALPRLMAAWLGTRVWSTYGGLRFEPVGDGTSRRRVVLASVNPGSAPVGAWVPSDPGQLPDGPWEVTAPDGSTFPDSDVEMYALPTSDGQRLTGLALLNARDMAAGESDLRNLSRIRHYADRIEYEGISTTGPLLPLPRGLTDAIVVVGDGEAGLPRLSTGQSHMVTSGELAAFLFRQIAVSVPAHWPVWLVGRGLASLPAGADRLEYVPGAQDVATRLGRSAFASDAKQRVMGDANPPYLAVVEDPENPEPGYREFPPEPWPPALSMWADVA
ncbi:hypothetical protein AB4212_29950, partial [Streptomyces sp. 2MCAF27]